MGRDPRGQHMDMRKPRGTLGFPRLRLRGRAGLPYEIGVPQAMALGTGASL